MAEPLDRRRRRRHLGRAAPARHRRHRRPEDRRPLAAPQGARRRRAGSSPSPAASSRPTAGWPRTRSTRSSRRSGRGRRAAPSGCRSLGADGPAPDDEHLAGRYGSMAADVLRARPTIDPISTSRSSPGLPYRKAEAIYAVRDEMATTLDDVLVAPHPRPAARRATRPPRPPTTSRGSSRPSSAGTRRAISREVDAYRAALEHERTAAGLARAPGARPPSLGRLTPSSRPRNLRGD